MAENRARVSRRGAFRLILGGVALPTMSMAPDWRGGHAETVAPSDGLARSEPERQGVASSAILAFLDDVENAGFEVQSFMLWRRGYVVAEGWWSPYRADRVHMMHSLTKSVTVCAVGLAVADGRFRLDDKVTSFFAEYLPATVSDNLAAMTVQDLLTMRTGHASMVSGSVWRPIKSSWIAEFFKIPVVSKPGTNFVYTSAASYMLSALVTKTTGQSVADYLKPRLFDPLGIPDYQWPPGPEGISPGANGLSWRTADSLKLGILYAQDGIWRGKQILPKEWTDAVQYPHVKDTYGYQWWLGPEGAFLADGLFSQLSIVFPRHNAVLAITAGIPEGSHFNKFVFTHFPAAFSDTTEKIGRDVAALKARTETLRLSPPARRTNSPIVRHVSGKVYQFPDNADQVNTMQFDFTDDACTFSLQDYRGAHTIEVGLGRSIEGDTTMTGNKLHHEYELDRMRVVASAEWVDSRTFVMTWSFVETAFRDTVVCFFEGPWLRFDRSVNVNSAETSLPTLNGRTVRATDD
jgi:CubicO group peptidase (beta-lactamase class C family)